MSEMNIGIEIEAVLNKRLNNIRKGSYHQGVPVKGLKGWTAEHDGSLDDYREYGEDSMCIEFVSPIFKSRQELFGGLRSFREFLSNRGKYELFQVLSFNKTCGSHVHFSIPGFSFTEKAIFEIYPKVRNQFISRIRASNIQAKDDIIAHYRRQYAQELTKDLWRIRYRSVEFNLSSEESKGLEWRSLNLLNVKTWQEFLEFWKIVYDCLEYLFQMSRKYEHAENVELMPESEVDRNQVETDRVIIGYKARKRKKTFSKIKIPLTVEKEVFL
ncbi:MAG: amidoligase family protein [Deltaproteobacteria bacterium]|nr:amidoligase family protein [Deltaproteobacteria bacterium]